MNNTFSNILRGNKILSYLMILFSFFLPISTSALSVISILIFMVWISEGNFQERWVEISRHPLFILLAGYLLLYVVSLIWTDNFMIGIDLIKKQWKFLLFPIFLVSIRREHLRYYQGAFLAAITLSVLASFLQWQGVIVGLHGSVTDPTPFVDRVDYTPFLALSFFMFIEAAIYRLQGRLRLFAGFLALLVAADIFIVQGRTGQVVFLVLVVLTILQFFRGRVLLSAILSACCLLVILFGAYHLSHNFRSRVNQTVSNFNDFRTKPGTSLGQRLTFAINTVKLIKSHPLLGVGPGDFKDEYGRINQRNSPSFPYTDNPHNQYLLTLAYFGLPGLILLGALFWKMISLTYQCHDGLERIRMGFIVFWLTIMAGESYLVHVHAGFLFIFGVALLFKDFSGNHSKKVWPVNLLS